MKSGIPTLLSIFLPFYFSPSTNVPFGLYVTADLHKEATAEKIFLVHASQFLLSLPLLL